MPNIVFGLVAIAVGLWGLSVWWWSVAEFLRGFVPIALILFGLVALGAGVSVVRDKEEDDLSDEELAGED
ncbi:MAG: magnetosome protein MamI [Nitrospinota bacterium]